MKKTNIILVTIIVILLIALAIMTKSGIKAGDIVLNTSAENVTIEILKDTITNTSVEILITDNNEDKYGWDKSYRIQRKENSQWNDLKPIKDLSFTEIAYNLDENNQLKQKINWENFMEN